MVRKILHVIPSVGPLRGGPSEMVRTMAGALAAAGREVHVATTDDNGPLERLKVPLGEPLKREGVTYWHFRRQTGFYQCSLPLERWLARHVEDFDLVHIHALFSFSTAAAAYWAARRGVPYIVRPLGTLNEWGMKHRRPWLKHLSFRLLESRILAKAALVHYTSEQERAEAAGLGQRHASIIIPNAVEEPGAAEENRFREAHPELAGRRLALFLSRLDPKKGLDLLLEAFRQVRISCPDLALVIVGGGEAGFVEGLKRQAREAGIEDGVYWAGFLEGAEKWAAYRAADLFVLPSYSENFGIAVVEAMYMGVPVVITDQVAIHREVSGAGAGLVTRCDAREIGEAMAALLANGQLRERTARNGRDLALARFTRKSLTASLLEAYSLLRPGALAVH